ncbi:MAG: Pycsar system effector family protein [Gammaproteobacteria bacterium]
MNSDQENSAPKPVELGPNDPEPTDLPESMSVYTLRATQQAQSNLLTLADLKASIAMMMVAIMILLVIVLSRLNLPGFINENLAPTMGLFLLLEGTSFFLALTVITPMTINKLKLTSIESAPNKLFFGFFTQFPQDTFVKHMKQELRNPEVVEEMLLKNIYQVGMTLQGKYAVLKYVYIFAAAGMLVPVGPAIYAALTG